MTAKELETTTRLWPLLRERLLPAGDGPSGEVWIHGVSVGEVEVALSVSAAIARRSPGRSRLVTASTPAGRALLARRAVAAGVGARAFPLDLPRSVKRFFDAVRPRLLVLVETEMWPVVLREARRRGVPVLVANARLGERSARRYAAGRRLFKPLFASLAAVAARTPEDAVRFASVGVAPERVFVAGDLKFDRAEPDPPPFADRARRLAGGRPVLVAGSAAEEEIPVFLEISAALRRDGLEILLVLAPRQPASFETAVTRAEAAGLVAARRSRLDDAPSRPDVLVLDTIGELAGTYRLGDAALLGGTFAPRGGHNVLEPLRAGLATVVGPSIHGIRRTVEAAGDAVVRASDALQATRLLRDLLGDPGRRERAREAARGLFRAHGGATDRVAACASRLLGEREAR